MQRFSANYIFPVNGTPIRNGVVVLDNNNFVVDVIDPKGKEKELASMEFHNGVIVPGFVNAHCHIELSHLKGRLHQSKGITGFVSQVRELRRREPKEVEFSIKQAISTLAINGTVAVGDICNTIDSLNAKLNSGIYFHNFIELFGLNPNDAREKIGLSLEVLERFQSNLKGSESITPHSTYSISEDLWRLINSHLVKNPSVVSIHYGESIQEYSILKDRSGLLAENFKALGILINLPDCDSPLEVVKQFIPKSSKVLFVHNTYSSENEIQQLLNHFEEPFFVICPTSNLFIEEKLPDIPMLTRQGATLALGTDSYASSNTLSVFDQMVILLDKFPSVTFTDAIRWATLNGAKALSIDSIYGSFNIGKKPGLNLITDFDFKSMRPSPNSRVKRLA